MNKYNKKYQKIVDELIKKSFPRLRGKWIVFFNFILYGNFIAQVLDFSFIKLIFVNPEKMNKCSKNDQRVIFIHELCHFERHMNRSFFEKIVFLVKYVFLKKTRRDEEKETDKLVIRKGYAKESYHQTKSFNSGHNKEFLKKVYATGYMNLKEIKDYAKKVGKW